MNTKVYLIFQYGREDPLGVCATEGMAAIAVSHAEARDMLELGYTVDTWYEPYEVMRTPSMVKGHFYGI